MRVIIDNKQLKVKLLREKNPIVCERFMSILPLEGTALTRNSEIFFIIPHSLGRGKLTNEVKAGDVAYWPMENSISFFYNDSKTQGNVIIFGKIIDGLEQIRGLTGVFTIRVEKIS